MVPYTSNKYFLDTKYIGKIVNLEVTGNNLNIFYNGELIASHKIINKKFNYHQNDMVSILKSDVMSFTKIMKSKNLK